MAVIIWETRAILSARYPRLQGLQALAFVAPLFLLVFANAYYVLAYNVPASFHRTDVPDGFALRRGHGVRHGRLRRYHSGHADRPILVTAQMIGDLLLVGVALRVILTAVERSRDRASP